jgi:hypothetical protein
VEPVQLYRFSHSHRAVVLVDVTSSARPRRLANSLRPEATASGRVTRRASSDSACLLPRSARVPGGMGVPESWECTRCPQRGPGLGVADRIFCLSRPHGGQPDVTGPLGGAFLIPRPLAEEPHFCVGVFGAEVTSTSALKPTAARRTQKHHCLAQFCGTASDLGDTSRHRTLTQHASRTAALAVLEKRRSATRLVTSLGRPALAWLLARRVWSHRALTEEAPEAGICAGLGTRAEHRPSLYHEPLPPRG